MIGSLGNIGRNPDGFAAQFAQVCFTVPDLDAALAEFSARFGAGPWFVGEGPPAHLDCSIYRGEPSPLGARFGLAYAGELMLELVEPRAGSRSIFSEVVDRRGYGLHHLGFLVDDFDGAEAALTAAGRDIVTTSVTPRGARIAMVDSGAALGILEEYIELNAAGAAFYEQMKAAHRAWDGQQLRA